MLVSATPLVHRRIQPLVTFSGVEPEYTLLVDHLPVVTEGEKCLVAVAGDSCELPDYCGQVERFHMKVQDLLLVICAGHHVLPGHKSDVEIFKAYSLDARGEFIPVELYFIDVYSLDRKYRYSVVLPWAMLSKLVVKTAVQHSFYVDKDLRICRRGTYLRSLTRLLSRRILDSEKQLYPGDAPFLEANSLRGASCRPSGTHEPYSCTDLIVVNETYALCSSVWTQLHPGACPMDRQYRRGEFGFEDVCTNITVLEKKKAFGEDPDDGWLQRSLKQVVNWLTTKIDDFAEFIEGLFLKLLEKVIAFMFSQLEVLDSLVEFVDSRYVVFELMVVSFIICYRSNLPAALIFVVIFGVTCGYDRTRDFRLLPELKALLLWSG